ITGPPFVQVGREAVYTFLFVLAAVLVVGVRSSGLITTERERDTWDALRLTPLLMGDIITQKFRGVYRAGCTWLIAYGAPALVLAAVLGVPYLIWMATRLVQAWLGVRVAVALGLYLSASAPSSRRALLGTITLGPVVAL